MWLNLWWHRRKPPWTSFATRHSHGGFREFGWHGHGSWLQGVLPATGHGSNSGNCCISELDESQNDQNLIRSLALNGLNISLVHFKFVSSAALILVDTLFSCLSPWFYKFISWELGVPHVQTPWTFISCFTSSFGWFWMVIGCFQSIQDPWLYQVISYPCAKAIAWSPWTIQPP